jgi:hypothetical protein
MYGRGIKKLAEGVRAIIDRGNERAAHKRTIRAQIVDSPEFRTRWNKKSAAPSAPPRRRRGKVPAFDLQIVLVASHGFSQVARQVARLSRQAGPRDLITILDGSSGMVTQHAALVPGRAELVNFPNNSVFHLRMRIPSIARDARWLALLEDHNAVPARWLAVIHALIDRPADQTSAYIGTISNLTSTSPWSWASFLMNFALHWRPVQESRTSLPIISNVVFSRALLPPVDFEFGEFESKFLPAVCRNAPVLNELWLDHVQHSGFVRATTLQFHNARVAGSRMRMGSPDAGTGLKNGLRHLVISRMRTVKPAIDAHPLKKELPRFTTLRMRWLALVIGVGFVWGSCFGHGSSPWKLE